MRQRFRVRNQLFAAETRSQGDHFEVKVFSLQLGDSYFRHETLAPLVHLFGRDQPQLLREAILRTHARVQEELEVDHDQREAIQNPDRLER